MSSSSSSSSFAPKKTYRVREFVPLRTRGCTVYKSVDEFSSPPPPTTTSDDDDDRSAPVSREKETRLEDTSRNGTRRLHSPAICRDERCGAHLENVPVQSVSMGDGGKLTNGNRHESSRSI